MIFTEFLRIPLNSVLLESLTLKYEDVLKLVIDFRERIEEKPVEELRDFLRKLYRYMDQRSMFVIEHDLVIDCEWTFKMILKKLIREGKLIERIERAATEKTVKIKAEEIKYFEDTIEDLHINFNSLASRIQTKKYHKQGYYKVLSEVCTQLEDTYKWLEKITVLIIPLILLS